MGNTASGQPMTGMRDEEERRMMQMLCSTASGKHTLKLAAAEQRFMQQREQAMRPAVSVSGGSTTAKPEEAGLLSRFTRRTMDALQDPVANAQIVAALNFYDLSLTLI